MECCIATHNSLELLCCTLSVDANSMEKIYIYIYREREREGGEMMKNNGKAAYL